MASIANELDLNGFEKEANQVTESMARMAQQRVEDYNKRQDAGQLTTDPYRVQQAIQNAIGKRQTPDQLYNELLKTNPRFANDVAAYLKAVGVVDINKPIPFGTNIIMQGQKGNLPQGPNTKIMDFDPLAKNFQQDPYKDINDIYDTDRLNPTLDPAVNEAYNQYKYKKQQNPERKFLDIVNELSARYPWMSQGNSPEYKRFTAKLISNKTGVDKRTT